MDQRVFNRKFQVDANGAICDGGGLVRSATRNDINLSTVEK